MRLLDERRHPLSTSCVPCHCRVPRCLCKIAPALGGGAVLLYSCVRVDGQFLLQKKWFGHSPRTKPASRSQPPHPSLSLLGRAPGSSEVTPLWAQSCTNQAPSSPAARRERVHPREEGGHGGLRAGAVLVQGGTLPQPP